MGIRRCIGWAASILVWLPAASQTTASLSGSVLDGVSRRGIANGSVEVALGDSTYRTATDSSGRFRFEALPTGIGAVSASAVGFAPVSLPDVWLRSGKPEQVELLLERAAKELPSARVLGATAERIRPGAFDLTVEKSLRYPATFFDPARLANSYPGVAATNDQANHFSVRGNGPNANAWWLEGVEIVSPNHLGNAGTPSDQPTFSGGGTNILSAQMLGNSRLLTGGLPVQYGNALGGIMDMRLRRGNADRSRYTIQAGLIGIDLSTEGPFAKGKRSSYLVNYRYSTLGLLSAMGVDIGDEAISFQDLAFNVSAPIGRRAWVNVFGMAGISQNDFAAKDTSEWEFDKDDRDIAYDARMGAVGISSTVPLGQAAHWRTSVAVSEGTQERSESRVLPNGNTVLLASALLRERKVSMNTAVAGKLVRGTTFTVGATAMERVIDRSSFLFLQENAGWLLRPYASVRADLLQRLTVDIGVAMPYSTDNSRTAWEPRALLELAVGRTSTVSVSAGSRAQLPQEQLLSGSFGPFFVLPTIGFTRSDEAVLAFATRVGKSATVLRAEVYAQEVSGIPVDPFFNRSYSLVNAWDEPTYSPLSPDGRSSNQGVEVMITRPMARNWSHQISATVFNSQYAGADGVERNTRWNNSYIVNAVLGREWAKQKEDSKRTWGVGLRANAMGGQRTTPIDEGASRVFQTTVYDPSRTNSEQLGTVYRIDVRVYVKREHRNRTGMWALDLLNATGAQNEAYRYFDVRQDKVITKYQLGLIPNLSYRIEF